MIRIQTKSYYKLWGAYTYITGDIYKSTKFYQQKPVFTINTVIYDVSLGKIYIEYLTYLHAHLTCLDDPLIIVLLICCGGNKWSVLLKQTLIINWSKTNTSFSFSIGGTGFLVNDRKTCSSENLANRINLHFLLPWTKVKLRLWILNS